MKIKQLDESKVDEIILEAEKEGQEEKKQSAEDINSGQPRDSIKKIGDKISLALVFVLLLLSIIQSVELFNLRNQIEKGQFSPGAAAAPAQGANQGLPSQQGGC